MKFSNIFSQSSCMQCFADHIISLILCFLLMCAGLGHLFFLLSFYFIISLVYFIYSFMIKPGIKPHLCLRVSTSVFLYSLFISSYEVKPVDNCQSRQSNVYQSNFRTSWMALVPGFYHSRSFSGDGWVGWLWPRDIIDIGFTVKHFER